MQEELSQMDLSSDDDWENNPDRLNKMAVLAISYHNIGSFLYSSSDPQPYDVSFFLFIRFGYLIRRFDVC